MKKLNYLLSALVLIGVLFTVGCGGDDSPGLTPEQTILTKLGKTWTASSVSFAGSTSTYADEFNGFTMTITGEKNYTTGGTVPAFGPFSQSNSSGAWDFESVPTNPNASSFPITRTSDGLVMTVELTDTAMTLSFNFSDDNGDGIHNNGREDAVTGAWVFSFTGN